MVASQFAMTSRHHGFSARNRRDHAGVWDFGWAWTCVIGVVGCWILAVHWTTCTTKEVDSVSRRKRHTGVGSEAHLRGRSASSIELPSPGAPIDDGRGIRADYRALPRDIPDQLRQRQAVTERGKPPTEERNNDCEVVIDGTGAVGILPGHVLTTNAPVSGSVSNGDYMYYTVCISQHRHHHKVVIDLQLERGEADLYVSASDEHPRVEGGSSWIAATLGNEHISLPTFAEDFLGIAPRHLYVGVHGRPSGMFSLSVRIFDISDKEVEARSPLRHTDT